CGQSAISQQLPDDLQDSTYQDAKAFFYAQIGSDAHLYTGINYPNYDPVIKGDPFLGGDQVRNGTVLYDGTLYRDIPLQYDIVSQKILINRYQQHFRITLVGSKVAWFDLPGHHFEHPAPGPGFASVDTAGFVDLLIPGKIALLARRIKKIQKGLHPEDPIFFSREDLFYLRKDGTYYPLTSKASLLDALNDQRAALKTFLRRHHLKVSRKNKNTNESVYRSAVTYYLTLKPGR
ncbi:MAG: hypothetical protein KGM98_08425, partial [Bacteroidota bacterium]|nr:hypothetical protein [Bacteroidota bacterium]